MNKTWIESGERRGVRTAEGRRTILRIIRGQEAMIGLSGNKVKRKKRGRRKEREI